MALSQQLSKPGQQLQAVHYFTSRIRANGRNAADMRRQLTYLEALGTLPGITLHFGHYLEKIKQCRNCGAQWTDYEEKMTDVNIAVQMLADAFEDRFDTALLISADSDQWLLHGRRRQAAQVATARDSGASGWFPAGTPGALALRSRNTL